jgi:hypothetical protein
MPALYQSPERLACCLHLRLQLGIGVLPEVDEPAVIVDGLVAVAERFVQLGQAAEHERIPQGGVPVVPEAAGIN